MYVHTFTYTRYKTFEQTITEISPKILEMSILLGNELFRQNFAHRTQNQLRIKYVRGQLLKII